MTTATKATAAKQPANGTSEEGNTISAIARVRPSLRARVLRQVRGCLLLLWILVLSFIAIGSYDESFQFLLKSAAITILGQAGVTYSLFGEAHDAPLELLKSSLERADQPNPPLCLQGYELLAVFSHAREKTNLPPIRVLIDHIQPNWNRVFKKQKEGTKCNRRDLNDIASKYFEWFQKLTDRFSAMVSQDNIDLKSLINDQTLLLVDETSTDSAKNTTIRRVSEPPAALPEVQDWLNRAREQFNKDKQTRALVRVFLWLSVIGAFGTLIFLIRDFINSNEERLLSDYIFRPILGIFLAVAMFLVDILAHSVISTANVLDIRYEPLYVLALGAGLLSETAYDALSKRIVTAYDKAKEAKVKGSSGGKNG